MKIASIIILLVLGKNCFASGLDLINSKHKANIKIVKQVSRKIGAITVEQLKLKIKDVVIEIESRSPKSSIEPDYQSNYFSRVKRNYDARKTPYPGELSSLIVCEKKYLPKEFIFKGRKVLSAYLSGSGAFGACIKNDVESLSCNWFVDSIDGLTLKKVKFVINKNKNCREEIESYFN